MIITFYVRDSTKTIFALNEVKFSWVMSLLIVILVALLNRWVDMTRARRYYSEKCPVNRPNPRHQKRLHRLTLHNNCFSLDQMTGPTKVCRQSEVCHCTDNADAGIPRYGVTSKWLLLCSTCHCWGARNAPSHHFMLASTYHLSDSYVCSSVYPSVHPS